MVGIAYFGYELIFMSLINVFMIHLLIFDYINFMLYMVNLFVNILVELKKKKYQEKYFKYKQKYLNLSGGVINESL